MRLTKYGHSCIRIEHDGGVLVIDPGVVSEREALDGVDAVLITHEHTDHLHVEALTAQRERRPFTLHGPASLTSTLDGLADLFEPVEPGSGFAAAGIPVRAYGGRHAVIHPDIPVVDNLAYLVDDRVYHPGDSLVVPDDVQIDTLFLPIHAPWTKFSESLDFLRAVGPRRAYALHDGYLNDNGLGVLNGNFSRLHEGEYRWLEPGTRVDA
ncbi:L-ascorbate metabolism protein UlaG, beta-lactamase superfamily [Micromonospora rhizosphaerae]|uniref:L-ascorbate metabolism protein UlaG, beta-lactamase superfamily n=1 Tax=Micromonospora rhizosphaerae TaxID=568872 RepID=A0A1C6RRU7_9ACTN|nr:MBL fold metallo-hydrolase [Micromonospora rhizosphaerae]SCL19924.1 L-ascorbate metabolism protein UlaG, beta-lactamase superfamily [Micromonospora rhizosphaerae]